MNDYTRTHILGEEKPVRWLGSSLADVRAFPTRARQIAGYQLWRVQQGLEPGDWKPMKGIGPGVKEIRIHAGRECRVVYTAAFSECVYVLHAFEKRTRKTPRADLRTARDRFTWLLMTRGGPS